MRIIKQKIRKFPLSDIQCFEITCYTLLSNEHMVSSRRILSLSCYVMLIQKYHKQFEWPWDTRCRVATMAYPQADDANNFTAYFLINGKLIFSTLTAGTQSIFIQMCTIYDIRCSSLVACILQTTNTNARL